MSKDTVERTFYLKLSYNPSGNWNSRLKASISTKFPSTEANEVVLQLPVTVPIALFQKPVITANLTVESDQIVHPEIDLEQIHNLEEMIESNLGIKVELAVPDELASSEE